MAALLFFFIFSIVISFLCSLWEAVILSITPTFVSRTEKENPGTGKRLRRFKEDIDRPLSAILTLNTIAHTMGAVGVGVQAGKLYGTHYMNLYFFEVSYESLIAGLMTLAILILSNNVFINSFIVFTDPTIVTFVPTGHKLKMTSMSGLLTAIHPLVQSIPFPPIP